MMSTLDFFKNARHLKPSPWQKINIKPLAKRLAEPMREDVAKPKIISNSQDNLSHFRLNSDLPNIHCRFSAFTRFLNYWNIPYLSIIKIEGNKYYTALDAHNFYREIQNSRI